MMILLYMRHLSRSRSGDLGQLFLMHASFDPPSSRGAVSTNPYAKISGRNCLLMRWIGTPVRFYPIFFHSCPDSTRPVVRSNKAEILLHFGFVINAVFISRQLLSYLFGLPLRPIHLVSRWRREFGSPHAHILVLTCCIASEPSRTPNSPRSRVYPVRSCKHLPQTLTRPLRSSQYCFWRLTVPWRTVMVVCSSSLRWDHSQLRSPQQS